MASLVVQWLRLCTPNAGGLGSIPGWETRPHMLQLRILHAVRLGKAKYIYIYIYIYICFKALPGCRGQRQMRNIYEAISIC